MLGHEVAGDVVEVGEGVTNVVVGDRVVLSHHVPCNTCRYCVTGNHTACHTLHTTNFDPGGFAEFVRMPALQTDRGIFKMPDSMTYEEGSFVEPLACVVRAQVRAGVRPGSTVLVMGSGISGLLHIRLALALGAGRVFATDVSQYRLDWALRSGATAAWDAIEAGDKLPDMLRDANDGNLADLVILGTGAPSAIDQGLACLDNGATFVVFAVPAPGQDHPMPLNELWRREVSVRTAYGAAPADLQMAMELIASGRVRCDRHDHAPVAAGAGGRGVRAGGGRRGEREGRHRAVAPSSTVPVRLRVCSRSSFVARARPSRRGCPVTPGAPRSAASPAR